MNRRRQTSICVDRCICSRVPFSDLKELVVAEGAKTLEELQALREFGINCRLCHPYVRRMLEDGRTAFHEIIRDEGPEGSP